MALKIVDEAGYKIVKSNLKNHSSYCDQMKGPNLYFDRDIMLLLEKK